MVQANILAKIFALETLHISGMFSKILLKKSILLFAKYIISVYVPLKVKDPPA